MIIQFFGVSILYCLFQEISLSLPSSRDCFYSKIEWKCNKTVEWFPNICCLFRIEKLRKQQNDYFKFFSIKIRISGSRSWGRFWLRVSRLFTNWEGWGQIKNLTLWLCETASQRHTQKVSSVAFVRLTPLVRLSHLERPPNGSIKGHLVPLKWGSFGLYQISIRGRFVRFMDSATMMTKEGI